MRSLRDDGIYTNGDDEELLEEGVTPAIVNDPALEDGEEAIEEPEIETEEEEDAF